MNRYVALVHGINVGGNAIVPMAALRDALTKQNLVDVATYIQSGNIIFSSEEKEASKLCLVITAVIQKNFGVDAKVVIFTKEQWEAIISDIPPWWGKDPAWKYNLLAAIVPTSPAEVLEATGELKPDIEQMETGPGVVYQGMSRELFGKTTTGKLASNPIYKNLTIRNYNTTLKIAELLSA